MIRTPAGLPPVTIPFALEAESWIVQDRLRALIRRLRCLGPLGYRHR